MEPWQEVRDLVEHYHPDQIEKAIKNIAGSLNTNGDMDEQYFLRLFYMMTAVSFIVCFALYIRTKPPWLRSGAFVCAVMPPFLAAGFFGPNQSPGTSPSASQQLGSVYNPDEGGMKESQPRGSAMYVADNLALGQQFDDAGGDLDNRDMPDLQDGQAPVMDSQTLSRLAMSMSRASDRYEAQIENLAQENRALADTLRDECAQNVELVSRKNSAFMENKGPSIVLPVNVWLGSTPRACKFPTRLAKVSGEHPASLDVCVG